MLQKKILNFLICIFFKLINKILPYEHFSHSTKCYKVFQLYKQMGIQAINQVRFALLEKQGAILPHHQSCTTSACPLAYFHTISFTPHLTQWLIMLSNLIPLDVALFCSLSAHELQSHLQMFGRFKKAGGDRRKKYPFNIYSQVSSVGVYKASMFCTRSVKKYRM